MTILTWQSSRNIENSLIDFLESEITDDSLTLLNESGVAVSNYLHRFNIPITSQKEYMKNFCGENHHNYTGGKPNCEICGRKLKSYKSKICKFCYMNVLKIPENNPMFGVRRFGKESPNFKHGKPKCKYCGKEIGYYNTQCQECYLKHLEGKNNPNYCHGLSHLPYTEDFKEIVEKIRERDNYLCQRCGKSQAKQLKESNRSLCVHHINYNKQDNSNNNLITLCLNCHTKSNGNRDYWYAYYTYIMETI